MSLAATVAKPVLWAAVEVTSLAAISLLSLIILARLLGPAEFGLAALALIIIQILILFVEAPFNDAIIQRAKLADAHLDTAFWTNCAIALVLIMVCFIAADFVAHIFDEPRLALMIKWLAIGIMFSAISSIMVAQLRREMRFKELALRSLISRSAGAAIAISMAYAGYGVWSIVAQQLVTVCTGAVLLSLTNVWRPRLHFSKSHLHELVVIGAPVFSTMLISFSTSRIYNIVIGHLLGITALGYWNVAMRVVDTVTGLLAQAANQVGLSLFAREQSALDVVRRGFYAATQMASLLSVPLFVGLIIVTHDLVALAFGDRWLPAVPTIQILAFGAMLYCVFMFGDVVFTALGRPKSTLFRSCFHLAASLIGLRVFHTSGLDAAALVWVGSYCVTFPLMLVKIRQLIQARFVDILRSIAQPFIAGSVMGIVLVSLKLHALENWTSLPRLAVLIPTGAMIYSISIRILAPSLAQRFFGLARSAGLRQQAPAAIDSTP